MAFLFGVVVGGLAVYYRAQVFDFAKGVYNKFKDGFNGK